jgi:hypothetical protein
MVFYALPIWSSWRDARNDFADRAQRVTLRWSLRQAGGAAAPSKPGRGPRPGGPLPSGQLGIGTGISRTRFRMGHRMPEEERPSATAHHESRI